MKRFGAKKAYLVFTLMMSVFISILPGCGGGGGGVWKQPVSVSATVPVNAATVVPVGNKLTVTFSAAMDPATINTTTFIVKQGNTPVSGRVDYSGVTAVFTPTANFAANTVFTATITTGAKTQGGNALANDYGWNFTTGSATDTTLPTVSSTIPVNAATGVATNSAVTATFSEAMDPATINAATFTVKQGATNVLGNVTFSGVTAVFTPTSALPAGNYTATITTGAKDLGNNALAANKVWNFTIGAGAVADTIAPTVLTTVPANAAINVAPTTAAVTATFSEAMAPLTITTTTFTLMQGATPVLGTVTFAGVTAVFTPTSTPLVVGPYTATITTVAKDLAGNALAVNKVWNFTVAAALPLQANPTAPVLGTAANYVILAKTGVSTVPGSVVTGDVGLSPTARIGLTGWSLITEPTDTFFTSAQVLAPSRLFASDNVGGATAADLTTAVGNMETAYTTAAGQTASSAATTNVGTGTLTSLTLTRGVYEWGSAVTIPTDLIFNGTATDVWILKVAGTLDMAATKNVTLTGGALPQNIFWQVSGAVTIGANTHFEGIILGQTLIELKTGASINGRLLAQTAVILDANIVTKP